MKLKPDLVGTELLAGQAGPADRLLVFPDPLLHRAVLLVEGCHPFGGALQVGDDEAETRDQLVM
jgi:hypothetical protein